MNSIRVLIVDDSRYMRKVVELCLRQTGVQFRQILEAADGREALAILRDNVVDLILCDIDMPHMDGLEFVQQLAEVPNATGVPVVMITSEGGEHHVVQALSCGAQGYIRKPFSTEDIRRHVIPLLSRGPETDSASPRTISGKR
jgi:two-component system chemotaxis response regulator CheY